MRDSPPPYGRAHQIYALPSGGRDASAAKGAIIARRRRRRRPSFVVVVLQVFIALAALALAAIAIAGSRLAWHATIDEIAPPSPTLFDPNLVRHGQRLASMGDCASCHTPGGGAPFAGGVPLETQFGTIYGTNITPEPKTGIGAWSEAAFRRALREGVSRDGHLLYPAFPYNHFTHLTDEDIGALYAYLMTRDPVQARPPPNRVGFPLQFRPLVAGWNLLYLKPGPRPQQASQSAELNRGVYLVDALAHCSTCHSPRNALGAERRGTFLAGGEAEGWHATALDDKSPSPVPWTLEPLAQYLRTGLVADHAMAAGPMQNVVQGLSHSDPADVRAIAAYIIAFMGAPTPEQLAREQASRQKAAQGGLANVRPVTPASAADEAMLALGAAVYAVSCAVCHDAGRGFSSGTALQLPLAVALHLPDPRNLLHIIREGIQPAQGRPGRWMPPFEGALTDEQLTALVIWLRRQGTDAPPWPDVVRTVKEGGNAP